MNKTRTYLTRQTWVFQLRDARYEFAVANRLPERYKAVLRQAYAHSDDEYNKSEEVYVINTLDHCSRNASKWVRPLEAWMERSANLGGKTAQLRLRRLPREPQASKSKAPPVQLPLDFYHPRWYNGLSAHDKEKYVKHTQVAFLPNAAESFIPPPHTHPDEKLSGAKFNKKYYDQLKSPYQLNTPGEEEEDDAEGPVGRGDQGNHEEEMEDSIDLEAISEGSDEEDKAANSKFFQNGDYGDLYDEEEEDEDWDAAKDEEEEDSDESSSDNGDARMAEGDASEPEEEV